MNYKRSKIIIFLAAAAIANLATAGLTNAAVRRPRPADTQQTANSSVRTMSTDPLRPGSSGTNRQTCATLQQISSRLTAGILKREKILTNGSETAFQKLAKTQTKQKELLAAERTKQDNLKKTTYGKLDVAAKTETQKQAATEFKTAVERAETARRTALDEAVRTFRAGVQNVLTERKQAGQTVMAEFKDAAVQYLRIAETNCNSGNINLSMIRTTLRSKITAAQNKLVNQRRTINQNAKSSLDALIQARKQARQKAADDFKAALQKAAADLRQNFK